MPEIVKKCKETVEKIVAYKCNCCHKVIDVEDDPMEAQEVMIFNWTGGYSSVFGDQIPYNLTLCQHCLKRLIGHYFINRETGKYFGE